MQIFSAKFFDGITSQPHDVQIVVTIKCIEIYFSDTNKLEWKYENISKNELGNSIRNNTNDRQLLVFSNEDFEIIKKHEFLKNKLKTKLFWTLANNDKFVFPLLLSVIGLFIVIYFWGAVIVTKIALPFISKETEVSWGKTIFKSMVSETTIDSNATLFINNYWKAMSISKDTNVHITVVEDEIMNAYALPGGNIVVYDSILRIMQNHTELSALLAHEYIHVQKRHSMQILVSSLSRSLIFALFLGDNAGGILQQFDVINQLNYNRKLEGEADKKGLELLDKAKINTRGMSQLFKHMQKALEKEEENKINIFGKEITIPEFFQTHPSLEKRITYTNSHPPHPIDSSKDSILKSNFSLLESTIKDE